MITGVLLAGGLSRRMGGGDKYFKPIGGKSLLDWTIERVKPQVSDLIINANADPQLFADYDLPLVPDVISGFAGPLAGILTGMDWSAQHHPERELIASFATDAPFIPLDLVSRLAEAMTKQGADIVCARSNERTHPVFALWPVQLREELRRAMIDEDMRKIGLWTSRYMTIPVEFETTPVDPFFNINKPDNLEQAEQLMKQLSGH